MRARTDPVKVTSPILIGSDADCPTARLAANRESKSVFRMLVSHRLGCHQDTRHAGIDFGLRGLLLTF